MRAQPVIVRGTAYPSQAAAARAFGLTRNVVATLLARHGHLDMLGTGNKGRRPANSRPVVIYGRTFPSLAAASRSLGLSAHQMQRWCANQSRPYFRDLILSALMAADARKTRAALKDADMIDRIGRAAA